METTDLQIQARERSRRKLRIGRGFSLDPEDFIESCTAILGKRGMGKTGTTKVVEEEAIRVHVPFIALDPIGTHWGLRSSFDGKEDGLKVLVVGGSHADIPFNRTAGAAIADAIVAANVPAVIDYSEESHAAAREFITAFGAELYKKNDTGRLVIIEEASELLPQRLRPDMTTVYDVVERLVTRGRNRGLGVLLVDQRPARINKDVLTQIDSLWIMGVTSPQDRDALKLWVEARADPDKLKEFDEGITACKRQEAWIWSPGSNIFQKVHVRNFKTLHPDKTHLRRLGILNARAVTTDVSPLIAKLGKDMARLVREKNEVAELPKLRQEVAKLKKQRDELEHMALEAKGKVQDPRAIQRAVAEATLPLKKENAGLRQEYGHLKRAISRVKVALETIDLDRELVAAIRERSLPRPEPGRPPAPEPMVRVGGQRMSEKVFRALDVDLPKDEGNNGEDFRVTKAHLKILAALARLHGIGIEKPSKTAVALWSPYRPTSGGFANYLGQLRSAGLIDYGGDGTAFLTDAGRKVVESMEITPEIPSNQEELHEQVFKMVGNSMARILRVLIAVHPNPIPKPDLAERCDPPFSPTSGGYANYLGTLRSMGLIDYTSDGVVAREVLFP